MSRFEIVRTDAGWHARLRASNGRVIFSSEVYTRRGGATGALTITARSFSPTARIWFSNGTGGSELRFGHPTDVYSTANPVEIRDVDERSTP